MYLFFNKNPNQNKKYNQIFHSKFNGNEVTVHSLRSEESGKEKYAEQTNLELIETGPLIRHNVPWFGYSSDIEMNETQNLFELKSPKESKRK